MATTGSAPPHPNQHPGYPPGGYRQPYGPHFAPHETYIVQGSAPRETSITRLTVPVLLVVTLGGFLIFATYLGTSQFNDIKHAIDKLVGKVESMTGELSSRIGRVEHDQAETRRETWSKADQAIWCAKAERANQAIGWTCSDEGSPVARYAQPQVRGWEARKK